MRAIKSKRRISDIKNRRLSDEYQEQASDKRHKEPLLKRRISREGVG